MDSLVARRLAAQQARWPCTAIGIGPMSANCVEATVELANEHRVDLMLVASRRQVDTDALGAGYVCGWNAARFAEFVRQRDRHGHVLLCRDHGGPWQNSQEIARGFDERQAMDSARRSYEEDIEAGFSVIHLDPSVIPSGEFDEAVILERLFALYDHVCDTAGRLGRDIVVEIGAEEQDHVSHSLDLLEGQLEQVARFCRENGRPPPFYVVVQTGAKVVETYNIGSLNSPYRVEDEVPTAVQLPLTINMLRRFGYHLKQHNSDYLTDEVVRWLPLYGVHAANVAPEFGVAESRALLAILESRQLHALRDRFLELAYESRKWEKWMLPDSRASVRERAVIAGHYVFSEPAFQELKERAQRDLDAAGLDLDHLLKARIKEQILRYLVGFRLVTA